MDLKMTVKHADVSEDDKLYAEEKVLKLKRYLDRIHNAELIWEGGAKDDYQVGLHIHAGKGQTLVAEGDGTTPADAVDVVVNKMESQLTKFKEKLKSKDRKSSGRMRAARLQELATPPPLDEDETTYGQIVERTDFTKNEETDRENE